MLPFLLNVWMLLSVAVELQTEETRTSRLKTLQQFCQKPGNSMTKITDFLSSKDKVNEKILRFFLFDKLHNVTLNSVPKTGSTSWRIVLLNNSMISGKPFGKRLTTGQAFITIHQYDIFNKSYTTPTKYMDKADILPALISYYHILTVRHPFDRLEATYINKIVMFDMYETREKILARRNISETEVAILSRNGANVRFEEFLEYILSNSESHWVSITNLTYPCTIPYR